MIKFKNEFEYKKYVEELKDAVKNDSWEKYMKENEYMDVYFESSCNPNFVGTSLSSPYYSEIPINSVCSCNVSSGDGKIPSDWIRVVRAVDYILNNECRPIAVLKLDDGQYHIENGKHRFYAHVILGKEQIPVSIREKVDKKIPKECMLRYELPFYNDDGIDIADPMQIEDFFNKYFLIEQKIGEIEKKLGKMKILTENIEANCDKNDKELLRKELNKVYDLSCNLEIESKILGDNFNEINFEKGQVKMEKIDDFRHKLSIEMNSGRKVVVNGVCSAGNTTRASKCTGYILNKLGYQIDKEYILNNGEFNLEDSRDARKLNFNIELDENLIKNEILPNVEKKKTFKEMDELNKEFIKLWSYLLKDNFIKTSDIYLSLENSYFIKGETYNYYLMGVDNKEGADCVYVFRDATIPFNNLTITFCGKVGVEMELYKKLKL